MTIRHPTSLITAALLAAALITACAEPPPAARPQRAEREPLTPTQLEQLRAELQPLTLDTSPSALYRLANATHDPTADDDLRRQAHHTLAVALLDAWLDARVHATLALDPDLEPDAREALDERGRAWFEHVTGALSAYQPAPDDDLEQQLQALVRRLLRHPDTAPFAERAILILQASSPGPSRHLSRERLARSLDAEPDAPLTHHALITLALPPLQALFTLDALTPNERAFHLAYTLSHLCREGIPALEDAPTPRHAITTLAKHCGFACQTPIEPGMSAPPTLRLDASIHQTCDAPAPDLPGRHLSLHNALAIQSLQELRRIASGLSTHSGPHAALLPVLRAELEAVVIPGALPFLAPEGPGGLTLPTLHHDRGPMPPSPALAILADGALRIAAWPAWRAPDDADGVAPAFDTAHAFPGAVVARSDWPEARDRIRAETALGAIRAAAPWAEPDDALPLLIDDSATAAQIQAAARVLRDAGASTLLIAAWPDEDATLVRRPELVATPLRIDVAESWVPRLRLRDFDASLFDPRAGGHTEALSIMRVQRYLPDIYEAVRRFRDARPALKGLVLEPAPALPGHTFVQALDTLRFRRSGDLSTSTHHLLAAEPLQDLSGSVTSLVGPLFLELPAP